jgi:hypothetical protein
VQGAQGAAGGGGGFAGPVYSEDDEEQAVSSTPPEIHVVQRGDTLWDICGYYFSDPWQWPRVWSYNPTITNPHWIYPGDQIRLAPGGGGGGGEAPAVVTPEPGEPPAPSARVVAAVRRTSFDLRQLAFIDNEELEWAGRIVGSPEERNMLAKGDEVYLDYPAGKAPQVGQRYAIYDGLEPVKQPSSGQVIGNYVRLYGEVQVLEVKKGRKARATIVYGTDVIERGMHVGPTRTQFKDVQPVAAQRDLEGQVVAILTTTEDQELSGGRQVVILDRGSQQGLVVGNRLKVLRRGDGRIHKGKRTTAGEDDRDFPDAVRGVVIVVAVDKSTAVALIVTADAEIEVGDHALMRQGQ